MVEWKNILAKILKYEKQVILLINVFEKDKKEAVFLYYSENYFTFVL